MSDPEILGETSLQLPNGLKTNAPAVHVPAENTVVWRVAAETDGDYNVKVETSRQAFSKRVVVAPGLAPVTCAAPRAPVGTNFRLWRAGFAEEFSSPINRGRVSIAKHSLRRLCMELDLAAFRSVPSGRFRLQEYSRYRNMKRRRSSSSKARPHLLLCIAILTLVLLTSLPCHAYAGPGAGFAVLSSFWTLFLAFLYSVYAFFSWPFRQVFRLFRRRKASGKAQVKRAVILGFDGMDPELADRFIQEGRLPNLKKLRDQGSFRKLQTTYPAISPVAWSTFMTGVNPGKHNIYDFLARDLSNYLPFLSSAEIQGPKHSLKIGKYTVPLGGPRIRGMRRGIPFWHWLGKAGIFCSVIRVPVTFPPEKFPGVLLSGMCVPDLKGSQGTFCLCTTRESGAGFREGGVRVPFERRGPVYRSYVPGPENPRGGGDSPGELRVPFEILAGSDHHEARFTVGSQRFTLKVGDYSDWIPVKFSAGLGFKAHGICRFYLKELSPEVEVYVTPVNIDTEPARSPHLASCGLFHLFSKIIRTLRHPWTRRGYLGIK